MSTNLLSFADGLTWENKWDRYTQTSESWFELDHITDPYDPNACVYSIQGYPQTFHVYVCDGDWELTDYNRGLDGHLYATFYNLREVTYSSTTPSLTGKTWLVTTASNLDGMNIEAVILIAGGTYVRWYDKEHRVTYDLYPAYDGQTFSKRSKTIDGTVYTEIISIEVGQNAPLCDCERWVPYTYTTDIVLDSDLDAYPINGPTAYNVWYFLKEYADNINVMDKHIYGGINYEHVLNSQQNPTFGNVATARIEFETYRIDTSFVGRHCTYTRNNRQIGIFNVVKAERLNSGGRYRITAYDNVYKFNTIIDEWLYHTDCYANRYQLFSTADTYDPTSTLSTTFTSGKQVHDYSQSHSGDILAAGLELEYNPSETWNDHIWRYKRVSSSSYITIPHQATTVTQTQIDELNTWLNAHKNEPIFRLYSWETVSGNTYGDAVELFIYSTAGVNYTSSGGSYRFNYISYTGSSTSSPWYVRNRTNTWYVPLGDSKTFYETSDIETYEQIQPNTDEGYYMLAISELHRSPVVVNGSTTPNAVMQSICQDLDLTFGGFGGGLSVRSMKDKPIYFGFTATNITATALVGYLAEICCGFIKAAVDGQIYLGNYQYGISTTVPSYAELDDTMYKTYNFSDETVDIGHPKITIKQDESDSNGVVKYYHDPWTHKDVGPTVRSDYVFIKNPWTLNSDLSIVETLAANMNDCASMSQPSSYVPMTITCFDDTFNGITINVGDKVVVNNKTTYVFSKKMTNSGVVFTSTGDNSKDENLVAQIESTNSLDGKDIVLKSYDYDNNSSASIKVDGNSGNIYITTGTGGHVYINGVQIDT